MSIIAHAPFSNGTFGGNDTSSFGKYANGTDTGMGEEEWDDEDQDREWDGEDHFDEVPEMDGVEYDRTGTLISGGVEQGGASAV
jgi:hypothetical protein